MKNREQDPNTGLRFPVHTAYREEGAGTWRLQRDTFLGLPVEMIEASSSSGIIISGGQGASLKTMPRPCRCTFSIPMSRCSGYATDAAPGPPVRRYGKEGEAAEYGRAKISLSEDARLFGRLKGEKETSVWMSHWDQVTELPKGFKATARSENGALAGFESPDGRISALQFHPEVAHTPRGNDILSAFIFDICGCKADWDLGHDWIDKEVGKIREKVGSGRVICGLSGGVDSTVSAVITSKAVGDNLHCIFVDHGLLRKNEADQVMETYRSLRLNVHKVDAEERFLSALAG